MLISQNSWRRNDVPLFAVGTLDDDLQILRFQFFAAQQPCHRAFLVRHVTAVGIIDFVGAAESRLFSILAGFASPQLNGTTIVFSDDAVCIARINRDRHKIEQSTITLPRFSNFVFGPLEFRQVDDRRMIDAVCIASHRPSSNIVSRRSTWCLEMARFATGDLRFAHTRPNQMQKLSERTVHTTTVYLKGQRVVLTRSSQNS